MVIAELTTRQRKLLAFTDGITTLEGKKGTGKTSVAVALAYNIREEFGMPIVSDFQMKTEFGPYTFLNLKSFLEDLRTVSNATKGESPYVAERAVDMLFEHNYPSVEGSFIIFDEAYKWLDSRSPQDKVTKLFGYWFSQVRHYKCGVILITPHLDMIDKRVVRQVDRIGRCSTDSTRGEIVALISDFSGKPLRIYFDAEKYWSMFDSWILTPFRASQLNVGKDAD